MTQELGEEETGKIQCLENEIEELRAKVRELSHGFTTEQRVRLINTRLRLEKEGEKLLHERNLLASAIGNAAIKVGLTDPYAKLTGQQLIAICDNLAEAILSQRNSVQRYQWLRANAALITSSNFHWRSKFGHPVADPSLDEAIDNAMKETK